MTKELTSSADVTYNATDYKSLSVLFMPKKEVAINYFELLSKKLHLLYCINFDDTGYTKSEWLACFGDLDLDEAVIQYAEKYDLTPLKDIS